MALSAVDLSVRGRFWGAFQGAGVPSGRGRPEEGRLHARTISQCLVSTTKSRTRGLGLGRKSEHLGAALPTSQFDLRSPLQGFLYMNYMEKLAEGRIVAS